ELLGLEDRLEVNEVWLLADHTERTAPWETVEVKRTYDAAFQPVGVAFYAGNSGEHSAPWIGRSLRILFVNFARRTGCAMESLGPARRAAAPVDACRARSLPRPRARLHGPLGGLLAPVHAGPPQHRPRR